MTVVTKAANAHTVVATGWTNPSNCYATTNDSTYATLATARNATRSGDYGFPAFTTAEIPDHSTLTSVVFYTTYGLTATATGALVGEQARRNSTGATLGSEITRTAASMADANGTATGATLTDLRTANELRVRARATKGNSSTASTAQIDRLYLTVTFTETVSAAAGTLTITPSYSEVGKKATAQAVGTITPTLAMALEGVASQSESHSGTGELQLVTTLSLVGRKAAAGAAGSVGATLGYGQAGAKGTQAPAGALAPTLGYGQAGAKGGLVAADLALVPSFSLTATAWQPETHAGAGTLALSLTLTGSGTKAATYSATGPLAATFALAGAKATAGTGDIALVATLVGGVYVPVPPPVVVYGTRPRVRPDAPWRLGHGEMTLGYRMWAFGTKYESDDELVAALIG